MTRTILKLTGIGAIGALLAFATPALADMYSDWDSDSDLGISEQEFGTGLDSTGLYDDWDVDRDGTLTRDEFNTGLYNHYDVNDDDVLDSDEFSAYEDMGALDDL